MRPFPLLAAGLVATLAWAALPAEAYQQPTCIQPCCPLWGCVPPGIVHASCAASLDTFAASAACEAQGVALGQSAAWCPDLGPNVACANQHVTACEVRYPALGAASCEAIG